LLANFKPHRGNYDADGYEYTAPANAYSPNDYGLYNMAGNVAEWCEDAFEENASAVTWDLNSMNRDASNPRKVVRGGSWKDIGYYLETGTRTFEFEKNKRSYVGFRCVMRYLGRPTSR
jgi:formylglycine-generating enzyme required for sulfatase activity